MAEIKTPETVDKDRAAQEQLEQMMAASKKKSRRRKLLIGAAVLAAAGWFILRPMLGGKGPVDTGYMNYAAERRDLTVTISGSGALTPADSYNIIGLVSGDVLQADFEEGDLVQKDELLYRIDSSDVEKNIEQAELSLQSAGLSYQAALDGVDNLSPKSHVAGSVTRLYVEQGDEINMGAPIADISDTDTMTLKVNFHASDAERISAGQTAAVIMTETGEHLAGTVVSVSAVTTVGVGGTQLRQVELSVRNPGGISAGASAAAEIGGDYCAQSGLFEPNAATTVFSTASGTVERLSVHEGDRVQKDQVLCTLSGDAVRRQVESAQLGVRSSQLALDNARDLLDNYEIRSPIAGTIVEKNVKAGDKLDAGRTGVMAVIYDMTYLKLTLDIDELDIGSIRVGQEVSIEADALPGRAFTGVVDRVGVNGAVAAGVTTYPVKVLVRDYQELLPGMNVTAEVLIEEARDVLTVPISAVSRGSTVLIADETGKGDPDKGVPAGYRLQEVQTGRSSDEYIEILSGVAEGEQVGVSTATTSLIEQMISIGPAGRN